MVFILLVPIIITVCLLLQFKIDNIGLMMIAMVILPLVAMVLVLLYFILKECVLRRCQRYTLKDKNSFVKRILVKYLLWRSKVTGMIPVVLLSFDNHLYISVAKEIKNSNELISHVYFDTEVGPISLYPDGTALEIDGEYSFIYNWLPLDVERRTWMILQGAKGFDY
jgi:hypothetical protein